MNACHKYKNRQLDRCNLTPNEQEIVIFCDCIAIYNKYIININIIFIIYIMLIYII